MASFIDKAVNNVKTNIDDIVSNIFYQVTTRIVDRTPTGDINRWKTNVFKSDGVTRKKKYADYAPGTLANSWYCGIGGEIPTGLPVREPDLNVKGSLNNITTVSEQFPGQVAWFANPTPYAWRAEKLGWPKEGPRPYAMVGLTVVEFQEIVRIVVNGAKYDKNSTTR